MKHHTTILALIIVSASMLSCLIIRKIVQQHETVAPFADVNGNVDWEKFNSWNSNEVARMEKKL